MNDGETNSGGAAESHKERMIGLFQVPEDIYDEELLVIGEILNGDIALANSGHGLSCKIFQPGARA